MFPQNHPPLPRLRSGFRQRSLASLTPAKQLNLQGSALPTELHRLTCYSGTLRRFSSAPSSFTRQKYKSVLKTNKLKTTSVAVRSLTSNAKTRIGSFDSVCQTRKARTAYAVKANASFSLIFNNQPRRCATRALAVLVHREGFEPSYLARRSRFTVCRL
jgi:hypothetical protein